MVLCSLLNQHAVLHVIIFVRKYINPPQVVCNQSEGKTYKYCDLTTYQSFGLVKNIWVYPSRKPFSQTLYFQGFQGVLYFYWDSQRVYWHFVECGRPRPTVNLNNRRQITDVRRRRINRTGDGKPAPYWLFYWIKYPAFPQFRLQNSRKRRL